MARVFNNREGFSPKDDTLISRWFEEMPSGPLKGKRIDRETFKDLVQLYYDMSGWDAQGRPTRGKLVELGLYWLLEN
jgi:aldehyde:ferredoxin oxidoreductase